MTTTDVTIHGSGFKGPGYETGPSVIHVGPTNGPTNVTNIVIVSDSMIECTFPERELGWPHKVNVYVTNPHGTGVHLSVFEYAPHLPLAAFTIEPANGPASGGTPVVILGQGFLGVENIDPVTVVQLLSYGEIWDFTSIVIVSDIEIHANTPLGVAGQSGTLRIASSTEVAYLGDPATSSPGFIYDV